MEQGERLRPSAADLQARVVALVRGFGLHQPERTPCGQPVSVSVAHALSELAAAGPLGQAALAARLRLEKSTVSRLVDDLDRRGWVLRERDARDGRAVRLRLTEPGRRMAAQVETARAIRFARLLAAIPADERGNVLHGLDVLARAMASSAGDEGGDDDDVSKAAPGDGRRAGGGAGGLRQPLGAARDPATDGRPAAVRGAAGAADPRPVGGARG